MKKVFHVAVCALVIVAFGIALHRMLGPADVRTGQPTSLLRSLLPWDTSAPPKELTNEERMVVLPSPKGIPSSGKSAPSFQRKQLRPEMELNERRLFKAIEDSSNEKEQDLDLGEVSEPTVISDSGPISMEEQECGQSNSYEVLALPDSTIRIVQIKSCEKTVFFFIWDDQSGGVASGA